MANMYVYGLTRKQAGVIFSAYKKGNINVSEECIKFLYNTVVDFRCLSNSRYQDVMDRMKSGLEAIFAGNYEEASQSIMSSYEVYNLNFK